MRSPQTPCQTTPTPSLHLHREEERRGRGGRRGGGQEGEKEEGGKDGGEEAGGEKGRGEREKVHCRPECHTLPGDCWHPRKWPTPLHAPGIGHSSVLLPLLLHTQHTQHTQLCGLAISPADIHASRPANIHTLPPGRCCGLGRGTDRTSHHTSHHSPSGQTTSQALLSGHVIGARPELFPRGIRYGWNRSGMVKVQPVARIKSAALPTAVSPADRSIPARSRFARSSATPRRSERSQGQGAPHKPLSPISRMRY